MFFISRIEFRALLSLLLKIWIVLHNTFNYVTYHTLPGAGLCCHL